MKCIVTKQNKQILGYNTKLEIIQNYAIQIENYRIQMEHNTNEKFI
jgi:hypothetical protein